MTRLTLNHWDSGYRLFDVLKVLGPMLADTLFYVGDFEPGTWSSPEARLWTYIVTDSASNFDGTDRILLSHANLLYFARSSYGMGDYEILLAERPSDLYCNNWLGVIADLDDFEVAFRDPSAIESAEGLLGRAGFTSKRSEMPELVGLAPVKSADSRYIRRDISGIIETWDDEGYGKRVGWTQRSTALPGWIPEPDPLYRPQDTQDL